MNTRIQVAADDRTGALETAAALADRGLATAFVPWGADAPDDAVAVVRDLGSRHLDPVGAAGRAVAADGHAGVRRAHKIDSTLRGNWAIEVAARLRAAPGRRAAVVASFPAVGRTCVAGVVLDGGRPVADGPAGRDPRAPVVASRPADHLAAAGVTDVAHAADTAALVAWLASDPGAARVVVVDAADDAALGERCARLAAASDVLLVGTAAAVAAWAAPGITPVPADAGPLPRPVVVVRGSRHPVAVEQARRLVAALGRDRGATGTVLVCEPPAGLADPEAILAATAARVAALRATCRPATLVVLGGDTAAAVLGDGPMRVEGTAGIGVARCRAVDDDLLVLTRPGGFGDPDALVVLLGLG